MTRVTEPVVTLFHAFVVLHILFGSLGLVLFYFRSNNRDLPKLRLLPKKRKTTQIARPRNRQDGPLAKGAAT